MSDTDPLIGRILDGRYEIMRRVARGGMATVYVASDNRLARTVAIKIMHEGLGEDKNFVERFDREARAAARLSHPNVVSVFDQGHDDGRPYIVMEYIEGCTLRSLISKEAPMTPQRVLELMEPVANALAAAHESGLIHRDVKPENVLISERGLIKVADFGLARAVTAQTATAAQGLVIGTVSYIPPELVTAGTPDTRSDIYSFGIMLYEMLTGVKPHTGDSPIQVAYSHVHNDVPLPSQSKTKRGRIPNYVDALVTTSAAREPKNRPRDARVLLEHVKTARDALNRGVGDDPGLVAHMRMTTPMAKFDTTVMPIGIANGSGYHNEHTLQDLSIKSDGFGNEVTTTLPTTTRSVKINTRRTAKIGLKYTIRRVIAATIIMLLLAVVLWYALIFRYMPTPDLIGKTPEQATKIIQAAGLKGVFEKDFSEDIPAGKVARTDPAPTGRILKHGTITIYISKGPERYTVPDLTGKPEGDATKLLTDTRMTVGEKTQAYNDKIPAGSVISCDPKPGTQVKRNAAINLVISKGPEPIKIPDFTGKKFDDVIKEYEKLGLKIDKTESFSETVPKGSIIEQSPKNVDGFRGNTVTVKVSKGSELVTVPAVLLEDIDKGIAKLKAAGFQVEEVKTQYTNGIIIAQNPAPGAKAKRGSTVTVTRG